MKNQISDRGAIFKENRNGEEPPRARSRYIRVAHTATHWLFAAAGSLILSSCAPKYARLDGFALGTTYSLTVALRDTTGLRDEVERTLREVERSMSLYDSTSLLSRLNRGETDEVDTHITHCVAVARAVGKLSGGVYDITLRPVIDAWGFNENPAQRTPNLDSLMQFTGWDKISISNGRLIKSDPRVQLDLNSVAKGYAVDLLGEVMMERGSKDFMLEVGGEIVCRGVSPRGEEWRIGIDKPEWGNITPGLRRDTIITLTDCALATSGNYRRFRTDSLGNKIVHTIDGRTGRARPTDVLSATVIAPTCAEADALATALMAVGATRAREIMRDNNIRAELITATTRRPPNP